MKLNEVVNSKEFIEWIDRHKNDDILYIDGVIIDGSADIDIHYFDEKSKTYKVEEIYILI
jgi:hypothetical protein